MRFPATLRLEGPTNSLAGQEKIENRNDAWTIVEDILKGGIRT